MSTICGRFVPTFAEADTAMLTNVSMNAPYPFFWLKIRQVLSPRLMTCAADSRVLHYLKIRQVPRGEEASITMEDPVFGKVCYPVLPFLSEGGTPAGRPQLEMAL